MKKYTIMLSQLVEAPAGSKDCANCLYRQEEMRDGGHCYMFRDEPDGDACGQFKSILETQFQQCTTQSKRNDQHVITCNLGLWSVSAPTLDQAMREAQHYFIQYKAGGEYSEIIGGPTVLDVVNDISNRYT